MDDWDESVDLCQRVKSVDELKRKLDEKYDEWLIESLQGRLPQGVAERFNGIVRKYHQDKRQAEMARLVRATVVPTLDSAEGDLETDDRGGTDTFLHGFFEEKGLRALSAERTCKGDSFSRGPRTRLSLKTTTSWIS